MKFEMQIQGMTCQHCQGRVLQALRDVNGVLAAEVNLEQGSAWVETTDDVNEEQLKDAVEDWGYHVTRVTAL